MHSAVANNTESWSCWNWAVGTKTAGMKHQAVLCCRQGTSGSLNQYTEHHMLDPPAVHTPFKD